jgi:iron complex transport system permease protein
VHTPASEKAGFSLIKKHRFPAFVIGGLFIGLIIFGIVAIGSGPVFIKPSEVVTILLAQINLETLTPEQQPFSAIIIGIRLPRVIMAVLIGATLAISGAALQGLFRNPLADPTLIGVSSGSALSAASVIILGGSFLYALPEFIARSLLPFAAFLGGLLSTWLVYVISTNKGRTSVTTMLLAGIAINALASAGIGYLIFTADDLQIRDLTFWSLGSIGSSTWKTVLQTSPFLIIALAGIPFLAKPLNILLLGETEARHLGVNAERVKKIVILLAALGIGAAVAVSGIIGFVGLVVPHLIRLIIGPDHRFLMPASMLLGAALMLASDLFARMVVAPAELPIGIVTATIGAPFFIWLLVKNRGLRNYL